MCVMLCRVSDVVVVNVTVIVLSVDRSDVTPAAVYSQHHRPAWSILPIDPIRADLSLINHTQQCSGAWWRVPESEGRVLPLTVMQYLQPSSSPCCICYYRRAPPSKVSSARLSRSQTLHHTRCIHDATSCKRLSELRYLLVIQDVGLWTAYSIFTKLVDSYSFLIICTILTIRYGPGHMSVRKSSYSAVQFRLFVSNSWYLFTHSCAFVSLYH